MMRKLSLLFLLPFTLFGGPSKGSLVDELGFVKSCFEAKYAPLEWKQNFAGFNLDAEIARAVASVEGMREPSLKEYHRILKRFFNATKDYHVGVHFYATEEANLPFQIKGAEGRYFIVSVDRTSLPFSKFPFSVGDEVLTFGGRPIHAVIEELKESELGGNTAETDQALAEIMLTNRRAVNGDLVPSGFVEIVGKRREENRPRSVTLQWNYWPERVKGIHPVYCAEPNFSSWRQNPRKAIQTEKFFERMMIYSGWHGSHVGASLTENGHAIGARSSFLPKLGKKIWASKSDALFDAYMFHVDGHNIGYIRIPHYMGEDDEMKEFCQTIKFFQRSTDALVIDQLNNPGGSIFYLYSLISALTPKDQEIEAPKHRIMLSQEEVYMAISILDALEGVKELKQAKEVIGETLGGYPVSMETVQLMRTFCNFILDQWGKGQIFSEPTHLFGVDKITSHPDGAYTKPVLILTNELDFSGGDFFPATLQDAKRATIMGTRTAGAGGFVLGCQYPNKTAVADIHFTGSIAERILDKNPIENLGVQPDVRYQLSAIDMENNYVEYVDKIVETVLSLI